MGGCHQHRSPICSVVNSPLPSQFSLPFQWRAREGINYPRSRYGLDWIGFQKEHGRKGPLVSACRPHISIPSPTSHHNTCQFSTGLRAAHYYSHFFNWSIPTIPVSFSFDLSPFHFIVISIDSSPSVSSLRGIKSVQFFFHKSVDIVASFMLWCGAITMIVSFLHDHDC
jgi:hypothetical protein